MVWVHWKQVIKSFLKNKAEPFTAYASVISSIANLRFVYFQWDWKTRKCLEPSYWRGILYYILVVNEFIYCFVSLASMILYVLEGDIHVGTLVLDSLLLVGLFYGLFYQVSSLQNGPDVILHINQQTLLNEWLARILGMPLTDNWNRGICYLFSQTTNFTRPTVGFGMFPIFLRSQSAVNMYYRLGGQSGTISYVLYGIWSTYTFHLTYAITNFYGIVALCHTYFYTYWLDILRRRIERFQDPETGALTSHIFRMLQLQNKLAYRPYSRLVLPVVLFFASAWIVFAVCCLIRVMDQMSPLTIFIVSACACQATAVISLIIFSAHRMTYISKTFLVVREIFEKNMLEKRMNNSFSPLKTKVGKFYSITIDNMMTWSEELINYIMVLLSLV